MKPPKFLKRLLIATAIVAVFLIPWSYFSEGQKRDGLAIQFVGLTNYSGMRQPTALFAVRNLVGRAVNISYLVEVKTAAWPTYGRDMQAAWYSHGALAPHQVTTLPIYVPDYGTSWRARVDYDEGLTRWDTFRLSSAAFLYACKLNWAARIIWPRYKGRSILLPEMTVFTEPTPDLRRKVKASYSQLEPIRVFQDCKVAEDEKGFVVRIYSQSRERPGVEPPPYQMLRFDSATDVLSPLTDEEVAPWMKNYK